MSGIPADVSIYCQFGQVRIDNVLLVRVFFCHLHLYMFEAVAGCADEARNKCRALKVRDQITFLTPTSSKFLRFW